MSAYNDNIDERMVVNINAETISNVTDNFFPGHYPGEDHSFSSESFRRNLNIKIHKYEDFNLSFSLAGIHSSIANAIRRILISEIPTLAIDTAFFSANSSVIQEEVLAHRLGLIPFKGGKVGLTNFLKDYKKPESGQDPFSNSFDYNTVCLTLDVTCTHNPAADASETDPRKLFNHAHVYAKDIVFNPIGRQAEFFSGDNTIVPTNPNILIAKLRPGQRISCEMHMHKGIGADHAKFSPVATASYRLLPTITIQKPILGAEAVKFASCFPTGVIGLERVTRAEAEATSSPYAGHENEEKAVVLDAMKDTVSRECLRHPEFRDKVKLGRQRDHFIFSVESTGQLRSDDLVIEALAILKRKCLVLDQHIVRMAR